MSRSRTEEALCGTMDVEELIESIIRGLMFLAGVLGNNWLAVCSFPTQKSNIRTNEVLFVNLAASNLITNYLVDLPDTIADFAGRWFLGETFCGIFRFCSDLSETSSIYTTFFISIFWYQKLVGSLKRGGAPVQLDSLCLVACLLAGSWTVALVFSIPHFFFVSVEGTNDSEEDCVDVFPNPLAHQVYEVFYLTLANALPVAGLGFTSVRIVITLLQNRRRVRSQPTTEASRGEDKAANGDGADPGPGTSGDRKFSEPNIYTGVPAPASPDGGESGPDPKPGAQADIPKPNQPPKPAAGTSSQVRAAKSVVAVAMVFLVCWLTHLMLRITYSFQTHSLVVEVASYIAASYTCIIPYIFLYGVKKLHCSCCKS